MQTRVIYGPLLPETESPMREVGIYIAGVWSGALLAAVVFALFSGSSERRN